MAVEPHKYAIQHKHIHRQSSIGILAAPFFIQLVACADPLWVPPRGLRLQLPLTVLRCEAALAAVGAACLPAHQPRSQLGLVRHGVPQKQVVHARVPGAAGEAVHPEVALQTPQVVARDRGERGGFPTPLHRASRDHYFTAPAPPRCKTTNKNGLHHSPGKLAELSPLLGRGTRTAGEGRGSCSRTCCGQEGLSLVAAPAAAAAARIPRELVL